MSHVDDNRAHGFVVVAAAIQSARGGDLARVIQYPSECSASDPRSPLHVGTDACARARLLTVSLRAIEKMKRRRTATKKKKKLGHLSPGAQTHSHCSELTTIETIAVAIATTADTSSCSTFSFCFRFIQKFISKDTEPVAYSMHARYNGRRQPNYAF